MLRLVFAVLLLTASFATAADVKKEPAKPKFTPGQIADAQNKLLAAKCSLNRPEATRKDWEYFLRKPAEAPAAVDLIGFPNETSDADLAKLLPFAKRLPALKAIMLWNTEKITAKGLKTLAKELPDLQGLILTNANIPDRDLAELASMQRLSWIEINGMDIRDAGLNELASIPKLANLTLNGTRFITPRGIANLQKVKDLRELNMDISSDPTPLAEEIGKLKDLTRIHIFPVSDEAAAELGKLKELTSLDLTPLEESAKITPWDFRSRRAGTLSDRGLKEFMDCKALATIRVSGSVRVEGVPELAKLEGLAELDLNSTMTSDTGLAVVRKLKALTKLDLGYTSVTDEGIRDLADLPRLEILDLDENPQLGDKSLEAVTQIRSLISLSMDGTKVSATDCRGLSHLTALRHLSLKATNVGVTSFPILASARSVQVMDLRENCPNLGSSDIGPLQGMLPKTKVLAYSCRASGWVGAIGYNFKLPEVKSPRSNVTQPPRTATVVPKPLPPMPPPRVAPPTPARTGGGSPKP